MWSSKINDIHWLPCISLNKFIKIIPQKLALKWADNKIYAKMYSRFNRFKNHNHLTAINQIREKNYYLKKFNSILMYSNSDLMNYWMLLKVFKVFLLPPITIILTKRKHGSPDFISILNELVFYWLYSLFTKERTRKHSDFKYFFRSNSDSLKRS